ncbi:MAG: hypothetical protein DRH43_04965 [Deltaproteobacteria bacterium]|nr:MAG: hypothetical protein DRH43_04965 [Deltaproteobacteria bacterium]
MQHNNLFLISGKRRSQSGRTFSKYRKRKRPEPDLDILKESPCLHCELFVPDTPCPYVKECSKIDRFQRLAAVHCTLYKPHDVFSIGKP